MNIRTMLGIAALTVAVATPATGLGQSVNYPRYGGPAFGHSGYGSRLNYNGGLSQYQVGGATVTFGPGGGGYGYSSPIIGYAYPYPYYGGYTGYGNYGYAPYFSNYYGYGYGY